MKKIFDNFELYLGTLCSGAMIVILLLQVISRYVFNNAFSWSEEIAIILFIWSVYFGATAAIKTKQHLKLEIILDKVRPKTRLILELIGNFFFVVFNAIILTGFIPIVIRLKGNGTTTAVTGIPKSITYGVLPFLFVLMIIRLIQSSMDMIKQIKEMDPVDNVKKIYTE